MNAIARPPGATFSIRAFSLVLAALATGIPLFLLLLGLSIKTAQAIRESRLSVDLIPVPPPPAEPPHPAPARPAEHVAAPAPAEARIATPVERSPTELPAPPAPATAELSGTGAGTNPGPGLGGNGPGGAANGPRGGTAPVRTDPGWIFKPSPSDMRAYDPPRARMDNVEGEVLLSCRVLRTTQVADCRVVSERPRYYGFGKAALRASAIFRLAPPTIDGEPDENRRVGIPVSFHKYAR